MPWARSTTDNPDPVLLLTREWLVTNGLGGYASASVSGACTRRYHGLLIAALPAPLGRMVMLSHFGEEMALPDESVTFRIDTGSNWRRPCTRLSAGTSMPTCWPPLANTA